MAKSGEYVYRIPAQSGFLGIDQSKAQEFTPSGCAYDALNIEFEDGNLKTARCGKRAGYAKPADDIQAQFVNMFSVRYLSFFDEITGLTHKYENVLIGLNNNPSDSESIGFMVCENPLVEEDNVFSLIPAQDKQPYRITDIAYYLYNGDSVALVTFIEEGRDTPNYAIIRVSEVNEVT